MAKAADFRDEITAKIIEALESGTAPWQKPWNGREGFQNAITKHNYSGINTVILSMAALKFDSGAKDPRWATYKQASDAGWHVKKAQKGRTFCFGNPRWRRMKTAIKQ